MANLGELKAERLSDIVNDLAPRSNEELAEEIRSIAKEVLDLKQNQVDHLNVFMRKMSQQDEVISKCYRDIREMDADLALLIDVGTALLNRVMADDESPEERFMKKRKVI